MIIRTLNNEPLGEPSSQHSKTYPLRLLIPHILIGSIIGKGGARIKEIQEASGARLNASDSCLPLSTERSLVVMGVALSMVYFGYLNFLDGFRSLRMPSMTPLASVYAAIPICGVLVALFTVEQLVNGCSNGFADRQGEEVGA